SRATVFEPRGWAIRTLAGPSAPHRLEYALFRGVRGRLLRRDHAEVRHIGHRLGAVAHALLPGRRKLARSNMARALPERADAHRALVRSCFRHIGASFCEAFSASRFRTHDDYAARIDYDGWAHLEAARAAHGNTMLMSAHLGVWEVAPFGIGARIGPIHVVGRAPNNPLMAADLLGLREHLGHRMIEKHGAGRRIYTALRKGDTVGMLIDQRVRPSLGILAPFFGHPAWTSAGLAHMSIATGLPVVPIYCVPHETPGRYRLITRAAIEPPVVGRKAATDAHIAALTARYLEEVAAQIRQDPALWMWLHSRWKGAPETVDTGDSAAPTTADGA
ncbi:MAG: hypothetical protein AAF772_21210, partial [Acidobacteriota bacterium]